MTDVKTEKKSWKSEDARALEADVQRVWCETGVHTTKIGSNKNRYFATFPYPYMNGNLHLGHGFTMTKMDFACRFYRMIGYDVLEPFSFHLTGMPIMAATDKLREDFKIIDQNDGKTDSLPENCQYNIMKKMGIPDENIRKFTDPHYWGVYFPSVAEKTLQKFGIAYDQSRSFITTDANPFYDKFVKWQFRELFRKNALRFGTRYDIYSVKDEQPCLGHERSSGEEAGPSKSHLVLFKLTDADSVKKQIGLDEESKLSVFAVVSTTRPETLYGATNLWADKNGSYDACEVTYRVGTDTHTAIWLCKEYNLLSMTHQYRPTDQFEIISYNVVSSIKGADLVETMVEHPLWDEHDGDGVYPTLPILSLNYQGIDLTLKVDSTKGTGIVMSVPSDSPIDYLGYICADVENKYGNRIRSIVTVTHSDYTGSMMAPDLIDKVKVEKKTDTVSTHRVYSVPQKDMASIKEFCYITSATVSSMIVGPYKGQTITVARNSISVDNPSKIFCYYEPDQDAYSRSGDRLIVAKMDQWFIDYSDPAWKKRAHSHVETMDFNEESVRNSLHTTVDWLEQWPCSRTYGLGTTFPEEIVGEETWHMIDSLSDSTIYMALYTIYHLFEKYNIKPEELSHDVFDYIFLLKNYDSDDEKLVKFRPFREEFIHWYPLDMRVSAKDLVPNHLAMCIFNHVMIWDDEFIERYKTHCSNTGREFRSFGPKRYEINGYITVQKPGAKAGSSVKDAEKMSKSKGNFKTLDQAIDLFTADSVRFTFASSSTGTDDAYFDQDLCTRMIEKFHKVKDVITNIVTDIRDGKFKDRELTIIDRVFENEMTVVERDTINAYKRLDYRTATTSGFHILQGLYEWYVDNVNTNRNEYYNCHPSIMRRFVRTQLTLIYPVTPHICDWFRMSDEFKDTFASVIGPSETVFTVDPNTDFNSMIDQGLRWTHKYLSSTATEIMRKVQTLNKKKKVTKVTIFVAKEVTDVYERIAYRIFSDKGFFDGFPFTSIANSEIVTDAQKIDAVAMQDVKAVNTIIRAYKHIEEIVEEFGVEWLKSRVENRVSEKDALDAYLKYYLKRNASDIYVVETIDYTFSYEKDVEKVQNVNVNSPSIKFD
ncbi:cytoplasmic leucyl-tRNA synthetase [Yasminevirus sp. GU-2018]|uniref:leucine--tRNA ligase n=1 Tax=Yasminevirus sp. GU-2018 TaxID=2420051 RepID=A0A5K0U8Y5_9VIRU|nr:cytoplasmic leucyl-tRNA synthetase [Yasminevirus sp. GU-2018]